MVSGVLSGVETIIPVVRPLRNVNNFRSPGVNAEEGEEEEEEGSLISADECICCSSRTIRQDLHLGSNIFSQSCAYTLVHVYVGKECSVSLYSLIAQCFFKDVHLYTCIFISCLYLIQHGQ